MSAQRVTATVKMTYTEDGDLIAWWNHLPKGTRNAVMKDMMRDYIQRNKGSYRALLPRNVPQPFDPGRFVQMCEDTAWVRAALNDLPGYLERVIGQFGTLQVASNASVVTRQSPLETADENQIERRKTKMRKVQW